MSEIPLPPKELSFVDVRNFQRTGQEFYDHLILFGGLLPGDKVLDVGCGVGRVAIPLTRYLVGSYEGIDVVPEGIEWCQDNITPRYPNFDFQLADMKDDRYNPEGKQGSSEYRFPYADESFDFAFAASVFTHMFPKDVENYLREMCRVLQSGGRCLISWFLLNAESEGLIEAGKSAFNFRFPVAEGCLTANPERPEGALAYDEALARTMYAEAGLQVRSINFGRWCGRRAVSAGQDVVVAAKP